MRAARPSGRRLLAPGGKILEEAQRQAERFGQPRVGTEHILMALIKEGENVAVRLLNTMNVSTQKLYVDLLSAIGADPNLYKEDLGRRQGKTVRQVHWISTAVI